VQACCSVVLGIFAILSGFFVWLIKKPTPKSVPQPAYNYGPYAYYPSGYPQVPQAQKGAYPAPLPHHRPIRTRIRFLRPSGQASTGPQTHLVASIRPGVRPSAEPIAGPGAGPTNVPGWSKSPDSRASPGQVQSMQAPAYMPQPARAGMPQYQYTVRGCVWWPVHVPVPAPVSDDVRPEADGPGAVNTSATGFERSRRNLRASIALHGESHLLVSLLLRVRHTWMNRTCQPGVPWKDPGDQNRRTRHSSSRCSKQVNRGKTSKQRIR